jgi:Fur family ferric uptake transcriptional regulator
MLRARGYRVTPQRAVILEEVAHARGHTSARSIHRRASARLPGLNLATVYRTLEALHGAGMVDLMHVGSDRMLFALRDPDGFHGHLLCDLCGRMDLMEEKDLVALANHIGRRHKFRLDIRHLTLRGLCAQCAATSLEDQEAQPGVS